MHDVGGPVPEPQHIMNDVQKGSALIKWMCFFLIYWQLICHISDNGLEWLLCFHFKFLEVLNCSINSSFLRELLVAFPTTMYMVHKIVGLDTTS